jgi:hypothetical protein
MEVSPGWVAATVAVAGALWGIGKVVFGVVSRQEMKEVIATMKEEMNERHEKIVKELNDKHRENIKAIRAGNTRLGHLEYELGRVQERLKIQRRRRTDSNHLIGFEALDDIDEENTDDNGSGN